MAAKASTRERYGQVLVDLGREDPNIVVLGADLNKSTVTVLFAKEFPNRFFDLGIAEQNMVSMAAGMASSGKTVFASTFAVFGTGRAYDQLRISVAQPHLNVKLVVTHAGILTAEDGMSAQSIEDIALMRALPGFTVLVPADAVEAEQAVRAAAREYGPFYIRLSRPPTPVVHPNGFQFKVGVAEVMRPGKDTTIVATGIMVHAALEAAEDLFKEGIDCRVLNMSTLSPLDEEAVVKAARETGAVVTAEEHLKSGGLGSAVAQVLGERCPVPLRIVALDRYAESGTPEELLVKYGLTPTDVARAVRDALAAKRSG